MGGTPVTGDDTLRVPSIVIADRGSGRLSVGRDSGRRLESSMLSRPTSSMVMSSKCASLVAVGSSSSELSDRRELLELLEDFE